MMTRKRNNRNGLWSNNVALVQLLGLCPLLAVTSTVVNGLGLGIATLITLVLSNSIVSLIRGFVRSEVRLPVFVLIIASVVTIIELTIKALFYDLYLVLGIFIPTDRNQLRHHRPRRGFSPRATRSARPRSTA